MNWSNEEFQAMKKEEIARLEARGISIVDTSFLDYLLERLLQRAYEKYQETKRQKRGVAS